MTSLISVFKIIPAILLFDFYPAQCLKLHLFSINFKSFAEMIAIIIILIYVPWDYIKTVNKLSHVYNFYE